MQTEWSPSLTQHETDPALRPLEKLLELLDPAAEETCASADSSGQARELVDAAVKEFTRLIRSERFLRETILERNKEFEDKILELSIVRQIGDLAADSLQLENLLDRVLEVLVRELGVENASVMLLDSGSGELRVRAGRGLRDDEGPPAPAHATLRVGEGIAGWVAARNEPLVVNDVSRDVRFKHAHGTASTSGSIVCVPLRAGETVLGVLNLSASSPGSFAPHHTRVLRIVASQIASALRGIELHRKLRSFSAELEEQVGRRTAELEARTRDLNQKNEQVTELYFTLERAQRELEERNRALVEALTFNDNIVETVNVGISVLGHEGRFVTWNRAMATILEGALTKEDVLGKKPEELPPRLRENLLLGEPLREALMLGRASTRHGHVVELPSGGERHLNIHHLPVSITNDGLNHVITVVEDVTDNVGLHREKVKAERLAAITETMVSVNHEVNNPLAVILGYAQILQKTLDEHGGGEDEVHDEWLRKARRNLARIEGEAVRIREITQKLASLVEPVVTLYPASGGVRMVDVHQSR
jgi:PAS domain S-box-containing protein